MTLATAGGETRFKPGATLEGTASWHLGDDTNALEVRLFWYTSGKGSRDVEVVARERIDLPEVSGTRRFRFTVPDGPYSFSGKLITLAWALELVALPGGSTERLDLLVGPRPVEVDIR